MLVAVIALSASRNPALLHPTIAAGIVAMVFVLVYFDLQRRRETTMLHNLGVPAILVVAIATIPAAVAESAIEVAGRLVR